ncbi:MAG: helix-turn-helix domain-containing protein [Planctomycetota bacterium]|jgi:excisionase family DNA binding protein
MADTAVAENWLNTREAAEYLGVSEPTIFRWMREGRVSFFKLGGSTRFKRENLDMVARKVTGKEEGEGQRTRCAVCGHGYLLAGSVRSTGKVYFQPQRTKFFVLADSMIGVTASACPACGHVQMFADTGKIGKLMTEEDAAASNRARKE